jgi:hypothetical protein
MLCAVLTGPTAISANDADFELAGPQVVAIQGGITYFDFALTVLKPATSVRVRMTVDLSEIAKYALLASYTSGCSLSESSQLSCETVEDIAVPDPPQTFSISAISVDRTHEPPMDHKVIFLQVNATVNGTVQLHRQVAIILGPDNGVPDLAAIGANVNAHGATRQSIKVGIKNVGPVPWVTVADPPVIGNVDLPSNTEVKSSSDNCHKVSARRYACRARVVGPDETVWFEFTLAVDPDKPVSSGHITVLADVDANQDNNTATIRVTPDTLPLTGPRTWTFAIGGAALILLGALLFWITRRRNTRRASNRPQTQSPAES